jgi:hypothetical protein
LRDYNSSADDLWGPVDLAKFSWRKARGFHSCAMPQPGCGRSPCLGPLSRLDCMRTYPWRPVQASFLPPPLLLVKINDTWRARSS